jgi:hypothetical protein
MTATKETSKKYIGSGSTPVGVRGPTAAGSTGTITVVGTDTAHNLSVVTSGVAPNTTGVICTVTFATAYAATPYVVFSPANSITARLPVNASVFTTATNTTYSLNPGTTALANGTSYRWTVHVIG